MNFATLPVADLLAVLDLAGDDGHTIDVSSSAPDGSYVLRVRDGSTRFVLKAELVAFAPLGRELTSASCQQRIDVTMTLASRMPRGERSAAGTPAAPAPLASRAAAGRGGAAAPAFQSLGLVADKTGLARPDDATGNANADVGAQLLLPPGFSTDTSADSVTAVGSAPTV